MFYNTSGFTKIYFVADKRFYGYEMFPFWGVFPIFPAQTGFTLIIVIFSAFNPVHFSSFFTPKNRNVYMVDMQFLLNW